VRPHPLHQARGAHVTRHMNAQSRERSVDVLRVAGAQPFMRRVARRVAQHIVTTARDVRRPFRVAMSTQRDALCTCAQEDRRKCLTFARESGCIVRNDEWRSRTRTRDMISSNTWHMFATKESRTRSAHDRGDEATNDRSSSSAVNARHTGRHAHV